MPGGTRQQQAIANGKLVETANALVGDKFFETYCPPVNLNSLLEVCAAHELDLVLEDSRGMSKAQIDACFKLVEHSSAGDYKNSEIKWLPIRKRKEMVLPDMKYLVLFRRNSLVTSEAAGFASFMITYEDGYEVLYVYEIHFMPQWQNRGLGKRLMSTIEQIGRNVGVQKAMLTVFKANDHAVQWYRRLTYNEDEFSPGPRTLRNGTIKEPTYLILSKSLR